MTAKYQNLVENMRRHNIISIPNHDSQHPYLKLDEVVMASRKAGTWRMDTPHMNLATDAVITTGAVTLPIWVYQLSAWAGFITVMLGLIVVFLRLLIALRDFKAGKFIRDEDVDVRE